MLEASERRCFSVQIKQFWEDVLPETQRLLQLISVVNKISVRWRVGCYAVSYFW